MQQEKDLERLEEGILEEIGGQGTEVRHRRVNLRGQQMTNPPGHLWRDKWTALSGLLSQCAEVLHPQGYKAYRLPLKFKGGSGQAL